MALRSNRDLLSVEDVAAYLDVQPVTIYRWCREGRLPCLKLGKAWRIRRVALEEFLRQREQGNTLVGQLRAFVTIPDQIIAIAETRDDMHRLDAAFFQVGEVRDGMLVKFYSGEPLASLREAFTRHGLDVQRLEREGRLRFVPDAATRVGRAEALRALIEAEDGEGRSVWAAFDWIEPVHFEVALAQQEELGRVAGHDTAVILTQVLERITDDWPSVTLRRLRDLHRSLIELSSSGLVLSRRTLPPT